VSDRTDVTYIFDEQVSNASDESDTSTIFSDSSEFDESNTFVTFDSLN
jgi:hypothetical protein